MVEKPQEIAGSVTFEESALKVNFSGSGDDSAWAAVVKRAQERLASDKPRGVVLTARDCTGWGSRTVAALHSFRSAVRESNIAWNDNDLDPGMKRLLALAARGQGSSKADEPEKTLAERVGQAAIDRARSVQDFTAFVGEVSVALVKVVRGRAKIPADERRAAFLLCGPGSLPIVSLISALTGLILAYIGAIQLSQFGAAIYVANLVGIAMVREMGAIMAGVIMAGRIGASFAAQLGTMQVNEEIDALKTFGFSPFEYLVLPRVLAMIVMMPILTLWADIMGILGGVSIGVGALDLPFLQYVVQTRDSLNPTALWIGIVKGGVFGALVALSGCYYGIRCGRSAAAVGTAVTSAVVTGIVSIIVADAIFALICDILNI